MFGDYLIRVIAIMSFSRKRSRSEKSCHNIYIEKDSAEKRQVNEYITDCVKNVIDKNKTNISIMLLDAEKLCSIRSCLEYVEPSQITVVEYAPKTYNKMKMENIGINLEFGKIEDYMKNYMDDANTVYSFAFFDFMESKIRQSHLTCFENFIHKAPEFSVMAVTFSHRSHETIKNHVEEIRNHINSIGNKCNRLITFGVCYIYKRPRLENDKRGCLMIYIEAYIGPWENIYEEWRPRICYKPKSTETPDMVLTQWFGYPDKNDWTLEPFEKMKQCEGIKWKKLKFS
jgi:hypothetical protein